MHFYQFIYYFLFLYEFKFLFLILFKYFTIYFYFPKFLTQPYIFLFSMASDNQSFIPLYNFLPNT